KIRFRQSLSDILDNLDGAFFITGTARRGPWMFGLDYSWSSQSASHKPLGLVTVKGRVRLSTGTLTGGYTVVNTRDATVDLAVGLRGWDISSQIDVPALGRGLRKKESWVDPVVGIRGRWQMTPSWSLSGYADAGRGVFGHGSRFTWQYMVAANYSFNDAWSASVGYRRLGVDYNRNGVDLDLVMSGPLLGVTYRF